MQYTRNYNLKKPDYTDFADIEDINDNMDKLDEELAAPTGDSADSTTTFTTSDTADGGASSWTTVPALASGETHKSLFAKMSQMFKNIRFLYKLLGTTDISSIGNGTVTGGLSSLNDSLLDVGTLSSVPATWNGNYNLNFQPSLTNYRFILLIGRYNYTIEAVVLIPTTAALGSRVRVVYQTNFAQIEFNSSGTSATMSGFTGYTDVLLYGVF